jgi:hypothetical protein
MYRCVAASVRKRAQAEANELQSMNVLDQLRQSHQTTLQILDAALSKGKDRVALKALEVELKQLELNARITGQFSDAPQVNLMMAPEFVKLKQVIVDRLLPYPDARLALSEAFDALAEESMNDE